MSAADKGLAAKFWKWIGHVAFLSRFRPLTGRLPSGQPRRQTTKKAIILVWMMARISRSSLLRHHPDLPLVITTTWGISTTRRMDRIGIDSVRCCVGMALGVIVSGTRAGAVGDV
jgi:hypothetical protein